jgi:hypothetical protein
MGYYPLPSYLYYLDHDLVTDIQLAEYFKTQPDQSSFPHEHPRPLHKIFGLVDAPYYTIEVLQKEFF